MEPKTERQLKIPEGLTSRADISRIINELDSIENFLRDTAIRQPGSPMQLPKTSKLFDELVSTSQLNMLAKADRQYLSESLKWLRDNAPVLHISFSSDPSPLFVQRLTSWLRQHISPFIFLQIGLHPNIGAGCVVRTTNKYFDFSLRRRFASQRALLMKELLAGSSSTAPAQEAVKAEATA